MNRHAGNLALIILIIWMIVNIVGGITIASVGITTYRPVELQNKLSFLITANIIVCFASTWLVYRCMEDD